MIDTKIVLNWYNETKIDLHDKQVVFAKQLNYYDDFGDRFVYYNKVVVIDCKGHTDTYLQYLGERWYLK